MQVQPPIASVDDASASSNWSQQYLQDKSTSMDQGRLAWWYRLTAPPEPPASASFAKREAARRGKLASTLMFFFYIVFIGVAVLGLVIGNKVLTIAILSLIVLMAGALFFNRLGHPNITGIVIAVAVEAGLVVVIRLAPGGLDPSYLALFDILVFVELLVASLLPVNWIFFATALNVAFILYDIPNQLWDPAMILTMHSGFSAVLFRPISLHCVVTFILWLWVRNASQALERADRAESIATLEHEIAAQEHLVAEEKRLLETSIQQILQTHIRVSQGDFSARVPLNEGEPLWGVSGSLNNLLARLQRLHKIEKEMFPRLQRASQIEYEFRRLHNEINLSLQAVRQAENEQQSIRLRRSNTLLDLLAAELHGKQLSAPSDAPEHPVMPQRPQADSFPPRNRTGPLSPGNGSLNGPLSSGKGSTSGPLFPGKRTGPLFPDNHT